MSRQCSGVGPDAFYEILRLPLCADLTFCDGGSELDYGGPTKDLVLLVRRCGNWHCRWPFGFCNYSGKGAASVGQS